MKRSFKFKTIDELIDVANHQITYPCTVVLKYKTVRDSMSRNENIITEHTFAQWEGSWANEGPKYIVLERDDYNVLGMVKNRLRFSPYEFELIVNEMTIDEYVDHVKQKTGHHKNKIASPDEIRQHYVEIKEDIKQFRKFIAVSEKHVTYDDWYSNIHWPTKYKTKLDSSTL